MSTAGRGFLTLIAAAAAVSLAGCWYDRPNPWNTESDVDALRYKTEHDWMLEMREPYQAPQAKGSALAIPDLEGWRDSVLLHADATVLTYMRDQSVRKIAALETRAYSQAPMDENSKVQVYGLAWAARVEKIRLRMIEERIGSVNQQ
ncbi:MAG TPA: hypothetical protein VE981_08625 [Planctomycetota bacterium]|nr:hypothetical protein [Planctomycetota bacterium]